MPRRSTGCEACRKRKVRCDEAKPHCRKCVQYGIQCPGYRPSADKDLRFVNQTTYIVQKTGSHSSWNHRSTPEDATKQYTWQHHFYDEFRTIRQSHISNRHVHRIQLLSTFLDLYLPKCSDKSLTSNFDYIAKLPQIDLASPLLQVSIDSLCLAELGSLYQDERCLRESQARYVRALPMLANEIARPASTRIRSDHILAAITVLTLCELFDGIARGNDHGQGWISHVQGAQQFVKTIGPDGIKSEFDWTLLHNVRHSSMCMGFLRRKRVFFTEPKWLKVTEKLAENDQYVALYDLTLQIPGILERVDNLKISRGSLADIVSVCDDICQLRDRLQFWFDKFNLDRSIEPHRIVAVRDMKIFADLCLDRTFQTVFSFDSVQACSQQQLYWICCLLLDYNLYAIYREILASGSHPLVQSDTFTSRSVNDIERDMFIAATSYCRSIPFCCQPEVASVGRVGTFLLRIVQNYFEQAGHCKEFEWCKAVRRMLHSSSQNQTGIEHKNDVHGAPWATKHRCKSPMCNFRIECVAPAPLLLTGEYPSKGYVPRHYSREVTFDQTLAPERSVDSITNKTALLNDGGMTSFKKRERMGKLTLLTGLSVNGASALADERVLMDHAVPLAAV